MIIVHLFIHEKFLKCLLWPNSIVGVGHSRELNRHIALTELIFKWGEINNKQEQ